MTDDTYPAATAALFASLATTSVVGVDTATAAAPPGVSESTTPADHTTQADSSERPTST